MYKLYGVRSWGSMAVEAVLALCGAPYTVVDVEQDTERRFPPWFIELNPMGQVPVLMLPDGSVMTESAAMAIYLADAFPDAQLAPGLASPLRPRYLRWMVFLAANSYMTEGRWDFPSGYTDDPNGAQGVKSAAIRLMAKEWDIFAEALGRAPFILGAAMSAADIYAAMIAGWNNNLPSLFAKHPNLKALHDGVTAHPTVAAVWKRHGL
ncbi:glutathione S-transferase family protein [Metapseudomonas resinovorans]|uniref:glutathione S-transferase family protein n=1 Tax=Metapseudomonas resinovorans TaxID=53412 RepID=UPI000491062D|nr:glutathione S-transferase family protein [Pseudomonas resinovorans]